MSKNAFILHTSYSDSDEDSTFEDSLDELESTLREQVFSTEKEEPTKTPFTDLLQSSTFFSSNFKTLLNHEDLLKEAYKSTESPTKENNQQLK